MPRRRSPPPFNPVPAILSHALASPFGVLFRVSDPRLLKQRLYAAGATAKGLQIHTHPSDGSLLAVVNIAGTQEHSRRKDHAQNEQSSLDSSPYHD